MDNSRLEGILREFDGCVNVNVDQLSKWDAALNSPFDQMRFLDYITNRLLKPDGIFNLTPDALEYLVHQKRAIIDRLEMLSEIDELTLMPNRKAYENGIPKIMKRSKRQDYLSQGKTVGHLFLDVNSFKGEANDKHGHEFGNDVLIYVADALNELLRETDLKARYGGDEFVVVLDPMSLEAPEGYLKLLTYRINGFVQKKIGTSHPDKKSAVSVSLGLSILGKDAANADELLTHSDMAMYHAKQNSSSEGLTCHVYNPGISYVRKENRKEMEEN